MNFNAAILLRIRDTRQVSLFWKTFLSDGKITDFIALFKKLVYWEEEYGYLMINFTHIFEDE